MIPDNFLIRYVYGRDYGTNPYQYDSEDEFVFEYMCMLSFKILGLYG